MLRDRVEKEPHKFKCRIISCGHHITKPNGHFFDRGHEWRGDVPLGEAVKSIIRDGADFIKVMNDDIIFNQMELEEIVRVSHSMRKRVACHAVFPPSIKLAIEAGADTIEHAYPCDTVTATKMLQQGAVLCPTFIASKDSVNSAKSAETVASGLPDCTSDELYRWHNNLRNTLPVAFKKGISVIAGTDAGTILTPFDSLHRELGAFLDMGLSNLQALRTATINSAVALELENVIGSISVGKSADLVLVGIDPLDDLVCALSDIRMVVSRGIVVKSSIGDGRLFPYNRE